MTEIHNTKKFIECYESLAEASHKAGGSMRHVDLDKMTASQLLAEISTNDIRFYHSSEACGGASNISPF